MKKPKSKGLTHKKKTSRRKIDDTHYDNLFEKNVNTRERIIYFNRDVDNEGLDLIHKALDEFDAGENPKPVKIVISSYGGDTLDMFGIVDRIRDSKCHIMTYGSGKIMSAATFILAAGDERVITKNTWFMMHQSRIIADDDSDGMTGTFDECMNEMKWWHELENQMYKLYEELSKNNTKWTTFRKLCRKDHYIRAEDVLKLGLVERIQGVK